MDIIKDIKTKKVKSVSIHIGEMYASSEPIIIKTLLGSCVSVCLFDLKNKVGGMNHIAIPGKADLTKNTSQTRYAVNLMELLINDMLKKGAERPKLNAKVYGGGHLFTHIPLDRGIGKKNIDFIFKFLNLERINIIDKDIGGFYTRKIEYNLSNFRVEIEKIRLTKDTNLDKFKEEEETYLSHYDKEIERKTKAIIFNENLRKR